MGVGVVRVKQILCEDDSKKSNGKRQKQVSPLRRKRRACGRDDRVLVVGGRWKEEGRELKLAPLSFFSGFVDR